MRTPTTAAGWKSEAIRLRHLALTEQQRHRPGSAARLWAEAAAAWDQRCEHLAADGLLAEAARAGRTADADRKRAAECAAGYYC